MYGSIYSYLKYRESKQCVKKVPTPDNVDEYEYLWYLFAETSNRVNVILLCIVHHSKPSTVMPYPDQFTRIEFCNHPLIRKYYCFPIILRFCMLIQQSSWSMDVYWNLTIRKLDFAISLPWFS